MLLQQAIFKLEQIISQEDCKKMISYMDEKCKVKAEVMGKNNKPQTDTKIRDVLSHWLNNDDYGAPPYYKIVENGIRKGVQKYLQQFKFMGNLHLNEMNLLKYQKDNFYLKHVDASNTLNRTLSIIININEENEGGDLIFFNPYTDQAYSKPTLKTGDMVIFPSNFLYPHQVMPVTKGERYSIVSWLT